MKEKKIPEAENPVNFTGLKLGLVKDKAAGIPAVVVSFRHLFGEAGFTRGLKASFNMNQKKGFDCPSCAWPDPDDERSGIAEYCENGAKAIADEATKKKIGAAFFASHSVASLASLHDYELNSFGRIAEPLYLPKNASHYRPISWDDAFHKIALHLNSLSSADEAIFYTSGRTSNEAAFLYQLFVREFGTNNLPDCSNMCHESSGVALTESLGIGKGSVTLDDFNHAELIIIMGQNPGTNHPRMLTALQKAKSNAAKIIAINPLPETGLMGFANPQTLKGLFGIKEPLADIFLQVRLNGDMALLQAMAKMLVDADDSLPGSVIDHEFIKNKTEGSEDFLQYIRSVNLEELIQLSGVPEPDIRDAVEHIKNKKRIIICWAMGLTQHKNSVDTIKEIVNLLLLKGSIGIKGGGTCPVRGHSNVQGDRTMGIIEKPSTDFLNAIARNFGFEPPREHGLDVVNSIRAMHEGKASFFFAMGGNFLSATPDTIYTAAALRKCKMTVQVSTKLNRSHLVHGEEALILPCLGRSDEDLQNGTLQFVSCENSMGVVQQSKGVLKPISPHLKSEPAIVCELGKAVLGTRSKINWSKYADYDEIRDDIGRTIPGFEDYNARVRKPGGFYLPNINREGAFGTENGKARFHIAVPEQPKLAAGELMMMTIRSHDQFNTTIYGLNDRYRGIYNERRVVLMNRSDMLSLGLNEKDVVDLVNRFEGIERRAKRFLVVPYPIAEKCVATYFPEANVLVPVNSVADKSNTPTSKSVIISIEKRAD